MNLPLTHLRFLRRAETFFKTKPGVIDGEESWTYGDYGERCRRLASLLRFLELPPGGCVAYVAYNTHHLLEAYYGVNLAGGVLVPLNIRLSRQEIEFILSDCQAEIVFFSSGLSALVEEVGRDVPSIRHSILLDDPSPPPWSHPHAYETLLAGVKPEPTQDFSHVDENSGAELFYTSGTTGQPKGVILTHRNLYLHALQTAIATGVRESDIVLHAIPLFHANGWGLPQYLTLLGGTHVMLSRFDTGELLRLIERHRVTRFSLVPTMARMLLSDERLQRVDVSSLRSVSLGGAPSDPHLVAELTQALDCECYSGYGLTETGPVATLARLKSHQAVDEAEAFQFMSRAGFPVPGVELRLVDESDNDLPWDGHQCGELLIRADSVMEGYLHREDDTQSSLAGGWFRTGDMATIDPEGSVEIVDRKKDIIISGGENISSVEIEKVILAIPGVLECAVIPVPHPKWGEVPKALVVLQAGSGLRAEEVIEHCRQKLAGFKVPGSVTFLEDLPKGGTGKILKRQLRESFWKRQARRVH